MANTEIRSYVAPITAAQWVEITEALEDNVATVWSPWYSGPVDAVYIEANELAFTTDDGTGTYKIVTLADVKQIDIETEA